jgi:hypothetical protein
MFIAASGEAPRCFSAKDGSETHPTEEKAIHFAVTFTAWPLVSDAGGWAIT